MHGCLGTNCPHRPLSVGTRSRGEMQISCCQPVVWFSVASFQHDNNIKPLSCVCIYGAASLGCEVGEPLVGALPNSSVRRFGSTSLTLRPCFLACFAFTFQGVFNFCNPGAISHNEILEMYKQYIDPSFTYTNFTVDQQNKILLAGRSNNTLVRVGRVRSHSRHL